MANGGIDYAALAKKFGGTTERPDYASLAKSLGGTPAPEDATPVPPSQMTLPEFGEWAKDKYPQYANYPSVARGLMVLKDNPELHKYVVPEAPTAPNENAPTATISAQPKWYSSSGLKSLGYTALEKGLDWLPAAGGTVGGILGTGVSLPTLPTLAGPAAGGIAGATIGGSAGEAAKQLGERAIFGEGPPTSSEASEKVGWEGIKQGIYEALGRLGFGAMAKVAPVLKPGEEAAGEVISGVKVPETAGQMSESPMGLKAQTERYLKSTWMGGSLRRVVEAQENATRKILAKLSGVAEADPAMLEQNWAKARELTRMQADPLYDGLREIKAAPELQKVAGQIADDPTLRLVGKASDALQGAAGKYPNPESLKLANQVAKSLGYRDARAAMEVYERSIPATTRAGERIAAPAENRFLNLLPKDVQADLLRGGSTVGDAIAARSELREAAMKSAATDPDRARVLNEAWRKLNTAIDASLAPEQKAAKDAADQLWHRSYIMDEVADTLRSIESKQAPGSAKKVAPEVFVKLVNDLAHQDIGHAGESLVFRRPKLDILFDNPADRQDIVKLANFLGQRYSQLATAPTGAYFAKIAALTAIPGAIYAATSGHEQTAGADVGGLAGLYLLSNALARPGGAAVVLRYFSSTGATAAAAATRIVGMSLSEQKKKQSKGKVTKGLESIRDSYTQ